jgi:hypothetical protein
MPLLDGFHAAAEIVKREPTLPIIIYSSHESPQVELEAKKVGARCVVSKGNSPELQLRAIREVTAQLTAGSVPPCPDGCAGSQRGRSGIEHGSEERKRWASGAQLVGARLKSQRLVSNGELLATCGFC